MALATRINKKLRAIVWRLAGRWLAAEPLIYTTQGNIPLSSLRVAHYWDDEEGYIKLREVHFLGNKLVKESVYVKVKRTPEMQTVQGGL